MTQETKELLADIKKETELTHLKQFNATIGFLNDNFKIWNTIENKHSTCVTIEGILNGKRKVQTYVINMNGLLLLNGSKETNLLMDDALVASKYVFNELLNEGV